MDNSPVFDVGFLPSANVTDVAARRTNQVSKDVLVGITASADSQIKAGLARGDSAVDQLSQKALGSIDPRLNKATNTLLDLQQRADSATVMQLANLYQGLARYGISVPNQDQLLASHALATGVQRAENRAPSALPVDTGTTVRPVVNAGTGGTVLAPPPERVPPPGSRIVQGSAPAGCSCPVCRPFRCPPGTPPGPPCWICDICIESDAVIQNCPTQAYYCCCVAGKGGTCYFGNPGDPSFPKCDSSYGPFTTQGECDAFCAAVGPACIPEPCFPTSKCWYCITCPGDNGAQKCVLDSLINIKLAGCTVVSGPYKTAADCMAVCGIFNPPPPPPPPSEFYCVTGCAPGSLKLCIKPPPIQLAPTTPISAPTLSTVFCVNNTRQEIAAQGCTIVGGPYQSCAECLAACGNIIVPPPPPPPPPPGQCCPPATIVNLPPPPCPPATIQNIINVPSPGPGPYPDPCPPCPPGGIVPPSGEIVPCPPAIGADLRWFLDACSNDTIGPVDALFEVDKYSSDETLPGWVSSRRDKWTGIGEVSVEGMFPG